MEPLEKTNQLVRYKSNSRVVQTSTSIASPILIENEDSQKTSKFRIIPVLLIIMILFGIGYALWSSLLKYEAYGIVHAIIVDIEAAGKGVVEQLDYDVGDHVKEGDLLFIIKNNDLNREISRLEDEVALAKAKLTSEKSKISWETANNNDSYYAAVAELETVKGTLAESQSRLKAAVRNLNRIKKLLPKGHASQKEYDEALSEHDSLKATIAASKASISALNDRIDSIAALLSDTGNDQITPLKTELNSYVNEINRLKQVISENQVYSQFSGVIDSVFKEKGESVDSEPVLSIIVDETTSLVLYYKTDSSDIPEIGDTFDIEIPAAKTTVGSKVSRIASFVAKPPSQIEEFYTEDNLIRVFLMNYNGSIDDVVIGSVIAKRKEF